ncbi:MAG TPA: S8 family serine peptidase [Candidatus Paceibacterota bacterium]|nr:S8 family serine peptidase [Candidatus Paceibacterota bacterium]
MIKIEKYEISTETKVISSPIHYYPTKYGLDKELSGKGINLCIIDTGVPCHKSLASVAGKTNFCDGKSDINDKIGHATMIAGIIAGNDKKTILGIAPNVNLFCAKSIDEKGNCDINSLVAAVLWAIVSEVDVILMALGTSTDYQLLHDAIKKAHQQNICIVAATGNNIKQEHVDFPSRYPEVFSVGVKSKSTRWNKILEKEAKFVLVNKKNITTFGEDLFVKVNGSSMAAAVVAGCCCLLVENYKNVLKKEFSTKDILKDLKLLKF